MCLKDGKRKFEEPYDLLDRERASVEDQVKSFDSKLESLSQQLENFMVEKRALEEQVEKQGEKLLIEESERRILELDMTWLLQNGVVHMVDQVIKSIEFPLGV